MRNAMLINEKDTVIVAIEPLKKESTAEYDVQGTLHQVMVMEDIPMFHKLARTDIKAGDKIIKYGEYIGEAGCDIPAGTHVHTHNVVSVREKIVD